MYLQLNVVSMASIGFFIQCRMEDLQKIKGFLGIDGKILLKQGDAIECLRQLPTDSVDLIITDPPYNLSLFMKKRGTNMNKLLDGHFAASGWDDLDFVEWTQEAKLGVAVATISKKVDTINQHINKVMGNAPAKLKVSVNVSDVDWQKIQELFTKERNG